MKRIVAASVLATGFVAGLFPIFDGDIFWHLAAGRWIVEHGAVPRVDPFRFSAPGLPWVDHEWLFQVFAYGLERLVGLDLLVVVRAAALGGFALLLFTVCQRRGVGPGLAGLLALAATLGVRPRFLDRPEIVTLYGIVFLLTWLERRETRRASRFDGVGVGESPGAQRGPSAAVRRVTPPASGLRSAGGRFGVLSGDVMALAAGVAVWANFHGEALLAPLLAALFLFAAAVDPPGDGRPDASRWTEVVGVPLVLSAALLCTPAGWRIVEVPLGIRAALAGLGAVNPEWLPAWRAPQPYLYAGLAAVAALTLAVRRRTGRWPAPRWGLPTLALAVIALSAVRHQALFLAVAAPYAARALGALFDADGVAPRRERWLAGSAVAACALAVAWSAFPPATGPLRARHGSLRLGVGLAEGRFPERLAGVVAAHPGLGPLYNEFAQGGYLLWRLFPPRRVFLDGRMELEPELLHELVEARRSPIAWHALLTSRGAVGALVRYEPRRVPLVEPDANGRWTVLGTTTANSYLFARPLWSLVDWDDEAMLFVLPDTPGWPGEPYRVVDPENIEGMLRRAATDDEFRVAALAEVERKLAELPDCLRAARLAAALRSLPEDGRSTLPGDSAGRSGAAASP